MASRTIKTPGATTETTGQTTTEIADAALDHIQADETPDTKVAELKKSTQGEAGASSGSTGEVKPKKRVPVLTKDGWTTKEAD